MSLYETKEVNKLIDKYLDKDGDFYVISDGCLLDYGLAICTGYNLKTCIIKERYLNEWSSAYSVRFYNEMPSKYKKLIEEM